jgi:hypothetical protein
VDGSGVPWVVDVRGNVYRRTSNSPSSGGWSLLPGGACAKDIGVGPDGSAWIIGCTPTGANGNIYKWNGSVWDQAQGGAVRVAVAVSGIPWVVNQSNLIYRRTSRSPFSGGWSQMPGNARDVGAGPDGDVWKVGTESGSTGGFIYVWDEQPAGFKTPSRSEWVRLPGSATDIAVGPTGPWIVHSNAGIYRPVK